MNFHVLSYGTPSFKYQSTDDLVPETEKTIRSFSKLAAGWHFGKGTPPRPEIISTASKLLRYGIQLGFTKNDAFPGENGEIQISFYRDNATIETIVEIDNTISLYYEHDGIEEPGLRGKNYKEAVQRLAEISGQIWNTSVSLVHCTTNLPNIDILALPSGTPQTAQVHPWCKLAVQRIAAEHYALMYSAIMDHGSLVLRPYFGDSRKPSFRKEVV